ncbi:hypothetical protein BJX62DRAFT_129115 [Aspergillus germanicus]
MSDFCSSSGFMTSRHPYNVQRQRQRQRQLVHCANTLARATRFSYATSPQVPLRTIAGRRSLDSSRMHQVPKPLPCDSEPIHPSSRAATNRLPSDSQVTPTRIYRSMRRIPMHPLPMQPNRSMLTISRCPALTACMNTMQQTATRQRKKMAPPTPR